jgi:hypothetical protein
MMSTFPALGRGPGTVGSAFTTGVMVLGCLTAETLVELWAAANDTDTAAATASENFILVYIH